MYFWKGNKQNKHPVMDDATEHFFFFSFNNVSKLYKL